MLLAVRIESTELDTLLCLQISRNINSYEIQKYYNNFRWDENNQITVIRKLLVSVAQPKMLIPQVCESNAALKYEVSIKIWKKTLHCHFKIYFFSRFI